MGSFSLHKSLCNGYVIDRSIETNIAGKINKGTTGVEVLTGLQTENLLAYI